MTLDLAPIVQPVDFTQTYLKDQAAQQEGALQGQKIQQGALDLQAQKNLPDAVAAYKGGDQGALLQIAQANPEMARTLIAMENEKREGALTNVQIKGAQQEQQQRGLEIQQTIQAQHLQMIAREGQIASSLHTSLQGVNDPEQKAKIWDQYAKDAKAMGVEVHPELAKWTPEGEQLLPQLAEHGAMANQLLNPPKLPEGYTMQNGKAVPLPGLPESVVNPNQTADEKDFEYFKGLSPDDQQKFTAVKSGMPIMPIDAAALTAPGGAQSGTPPFPAPGGGAMPAKTPDAVSLGYVPRIGGADQGPVPLTPEQQQIEGKLSQLPPQVAGTVRAILTGRGEALKGFVMKSPYGQMVMGLVNQIDPSFDAVNYQARQKVREDFASSKLGTTGGNIALTNSTLPLLEKLQEASDNVGGVDSGFGPLNSTVNEATTAFKRGENSVAVRDYEAQQAITMPEMIKILKSTGGNKEDLEELKKNLDLGSSSPAQRKQAIKDFVNGLQEKINTWQDKYVDGMGTAAGQPNFLNKRSQATMQKFGIGDNQPADSTDSGKGIPEGAKPTGKSIGGKPVYQLPNGKGWIPD
jgi:hypothetical protein